ncbi:hypothetical protein ACI2KR_06670 [Pseudomonas luteola]
MKMSHEDFVRLSNMLDNKIEEIGTEAVRARYAQKLGKDTDKRFRWDMLYACPFTIRDPLITNMYLYLHDDHIDTALRVYFDNRPELTQAPANAA